MVMSDLAHANGLCHTQKQQQILMATYDSIDPTKIHFRETKTNPSGGKSIYISRHPISTDPQHNLTFQLSPEDSWHSGRFLTKAKFGIDSPMENSKDDCKRSLNLTAEDPGIFAWLKQLEDVVIGMATERSEELWGKKTDEPIVRDKLMSVCKEPPPDRAEFKPLIKTKIILKDPMRDDQKNVTAVFLAENVMAPSTQFPQGKIDLTPVDDPLRAVTRGSSCLAKVRVGSVWKSPIGFGISLMVTHLIVWPAENTTGPTSAFLFGGAEVNVGTAPIRKIADPEGFDEMDLGDGDIVQ